MINKCTLIGNVGKIPEIRTLQSGKRVASFSLATSETHKNASGEKVTDTQWHNCKAWGPLADVCEKYIKKGQMLYVEGKIVYSNYDDKDGNKKYITEIIAFTIQMLGGKKSDDVATRAEPQVQEPQQSTGDDFQDLPF